MNPNNVNLPTPDELTPDVMVELINQLSELNDCALSDPEGEDAGWAEIEIYLTGRGVPYGAHLGGAATHASVEYLKSFHTFSDLVIYLMGDDAKETLSWRQGWSCESTVVSSFAIGIPEVGPEPVVTDAMRDAAHAVIDRVSCSTEPSHNGHLMNRTVVDAITAALKAAPKTES